MRWPGAAETRCPAVATEVIAVHAEEPPATWVPRLGPRSWREEAGERSEEWVAPLRDAGLAVRTSSRRVTRSTR